MDNSEKSKVFRMLAKTLRDLGGQEFVTEWARKNPTDFMRLYVGAGQVVNADIMPLEPSGELTFNARDVEAHSIDVGDRGAGAFDRQKAAEYLSISTRLLDDLLSAGTITRIKLGRKTLIRRVDLDNYLSQLAKKSTP